MPQVNEISWLNYFFKFNLTLATIFILMNFLLPFKMVNVNIFLFNSKNFSFIF